MLFLNERAVEIQDTVIISWLFLEKSRRTMDHAANLLGETGEFAGPS